MIYEKQQTVDMLTDRSKQLLTISISPVLRYVTSQRHIFLCYELKYAEQHGLSQMQALEALLDLSSSGR